MMSILNGKKITLGITGSIAAFKAASLAGQLVKAGAEVSTIMTASAQKFITPLTFESITHRKVSCGIFSPHEYEPQHISLAENSDILVVAPATANCLGKLANGIADDLLTCIAMATRAKILIAPAMNDGMYTHQSTTKNIETLSSRGVYFIGPDQGRLASGKMGIGRMIAIETIFEKISQILS